MNLEFDLNAIQDLAYWIKIDRKKQKKILKLVEETAKNPFKGSGKPEPLKYSLSKCWSRRINPEHCLVYLIKEDKIKISACRFHY